MCVGITTQMRPDMISLRILLAGSMGVSGSSNPRAGCLHIPREAKLQHGKDEKVKEGRELV